MAVQISMKRHISIGKYCFENQTCMHDVVKFCTHQLFSVDIIVNRLTQGPGGGGRRPFIIALI